jgi:release factor glutamine methyltransferase
VARGREPLTVRRALADATRRLRAQGCHSPRLDAEILLAEALGTTRERLFAEPERELEAADAAAFAAMVGRRARREPVAYIVGHKAFRTIDLHLSEDTLIPRPETETLVEVALEKLALCDRPVPRLLDVGTGSGAVALAVAAEHPSVEVVASDAHRDALEVARLNAARLGLAGRVRFVVSDLFRDLPGGARFEVIVSNPPYVAGDSLDGLEPEIRGYEPQAALLGGVDGLDFYRRIVPEATTWLEPGGHLAVEIPDVSPDAVMRLFADAGRYEDVDLRRDLGGLPRVVVARERPAR